MNRRPRLPAGIRADEDLQRAVDEWQSAVVRLSRLDAVTTEVVRVRCARQHDCHT